LNFVFNDKIMYCAYMLIFASTKYLCLLEVKIHRIVIWDLDLITKSNPHFLDYKTRFEMIVNRDSSFDLFLFITQIN
jgi:hypothetical protein